ncbi:hypothetical protein HQN90_17050 [Paenibacillus alba]|uniref:hypothetical protein n=1 Tax=Paenibacillus alba TaxID=1197127 RepID=UPI00156704A4|nr:hypothetical protein [Paenibacillus alba]NQX67830.1 hypothetical protein [Paenibacillus alba]
MNKIAGTLLIVSGAFYLLFLELATKYFIYYQMVETKGTVKDFPLPEYIYTLPWILIIGGLVFVAFDIIVNFKKGI